MSNPTITLTVKGRMLTFCIRCLGSLMRLLRGKKWQYPRAFAEDPRSMSWKDIVYFGYKYYCYPPVKSLPYQDGMMLKTAPEHAFQGTVQSRISVSIGGDLMPYELIKPSKTRHLWDETGDFFFSSDIVFANLETPVDLSQKPSFVPEVMLNDMHFNTDEQTFKIFSGNGVYKGYDVLSIANNHSLDMGEQGLLNTIRYLEGKGIMPVGASKTEADFNAADKIIEKNGIKVGFLAYTYSLNQFTTPADKPWLVNLLPLNTAEPGISLIQTQAAALRSAGADIIICSLHCGNAYQAFPNPNIVQLFQNVFELCGVDVIAGGHPHNMQPWGWHEWQYKGKMKRGFAVYSLADFIAWDIFTWCHLCAMIKLTIARNDSGMVYLENAEVKPNYMQLDKAGNLRLRDFNRLMQDPEELAALPAINRKEAEVLRRFYRLISGQEF